MMNSRHVSPLGSALRLADLALASQVDHSQRWGEWADISALLPPPMASLYKGQGRPGQIRFIKTTVTRIETGTAFLKCVQFYKRIFQTIPGYYVAYLNILS